MKVYYVRHGKTEWNLEGRFQGYSGDSKLLEESFLDLESLGEYLATVPFDKIYSSDLQRAHITAERIADLNHYCKSVETKAGFREWNFGRLEGTKIGVFAIFIPSSTMHLNRMWPSSEQICSKGRLFHKLPHASSLL